MSKNISYSSIIIDTERKYKLKINNLVALDLIKKPRRSKCSGCPDTLFGES
jgi:hypothetical protein